ncbi:hypothetical protein SAMN05421539_102285 [Jannaschia seohaensis]|uniref:Uncharacterized protein n=1 Tax=Jannaschia seohaensis TaxID=475081 RepID=A0A2Y9AGH0_9RHOB|nr:hypothetical protein BCF38_102285 [Jannaschia seohaensis]SSA41447.1 hypothetical protein SAMN05421539_102285 [Jannaschia seohaensis]
MTLDLARHARMIVGRPVVLTATEMAIRSRPATRLSPVQPRPALVDAVFGPGTPISERRLDSHLRNIRAKPARAGGSKLGSVRGHAPHELAAIAVGRGDGGAGKHADPVDARPRRAAISRAGNWLPPYRPAAGQGHRGGRASLARILASRSCGPIPRVGTMQPMMPRGTARFAPARTSNRSGRITGRTQPAPRPAQAVESGRGGSLKRLGRPAHGSFPPAYRPFSVGGPSADHCPRSANIRDRRALPRPPTSRSRLDRPPRIVRLSILAHAAPGRHLPRRPETCPASPASSAGRHVRRFSQAARPSDASTGPCTAKAPRPGYGIRRSATATPAQPSPLPGRSRHRTGPRSGASSQDRARRKPMRPLPPSGRPESVSLDLRWPPPGRMSPLLAQDGQRPVHRWPRHDST